MRISTLCQRLFAQNNKLGCVLLLVASTKHTHTELGSLGGGSGKGKHNKNKNNNITGTAAAIARNGQHKYD